MYNKYMKENNYQPIIKIFGKGKPNVFVVGCIHGDELVGKNIISELNKLEILKGTLTTIIANPLALKNKKRFIDQDLNRCFAGKKNGKVEEKIAYSLMKIIKKADYLIDVHSTVTNTRDVTIIKKNNKNIRKLIQTINPKRVVFMPKEIGHGSLINHCSSGVSFEYGKHKSKNTFEKSLKDIKKVLCDLKMIKDIKIKQKKYKTEYYKVYSIENKPKDFVMKKNLQNFKLIRKGQELGFVNNKKILAKESFYPVLFGLKSYKDIMGFKAKKIKNF